MWRSRCFWRLFGLLALVTTSVIAVLGTLLIRDARIDARRRLEESLRRQAGLVRLLVEARLPPGTPPARTVLDGVPAGLAEHISLIDRTGRVLAGADAGASLEDWASPKPDDLGRTAAGIVSVRESPDTGATLVAVTVALRPGSPNPGDPLYVVLTTPVEGFRLDDWHVTATAILVGLFGSALVAMRQYAHLSSPLAQLRAAADRLADGELGSKVFLADGRDEFDQVGTAFNRLSERLASRISELEEDRQQLRTILSGMVEGVVALDAEQRILFANQRAAELLDFQASLAVGRKLWEIVRQRRLQEVVRQAFTGTGPVREELSWTGTPDRSLTVHAARLPGQPARSVVVVLHDTTELRRLEKLRQEFVANVSHELKTPLSIIKAHVETLLDGAVDDVHHRGQFLERISEQAERLYALILDLLSLARIEAGTEQYYFQALAVEEVVVACLERHQARADGKNQTLDTDPPAAPLPEKQADLTIWADDDAICHILDNLVDNALKYTPPGGRVCVRWRADGAFARLEVEDTGIGIPERDLPRIFERFYRVDKARSRELGGTGLGLSIVKHLVQALHGTVHATSRLGHGTTFVIRLPRQGPPT